MKLYCADAIAFFGSISSSKHLYLCIHLESQLNCDCVIRSAGSHTPIDLIAGNGKVVFAVQVKQGGHISKEEEKL